MMTMEGKRTLVTGAASPMGREIVRVFVENGALVLAVDASDDKVEAAIDALDLPDSDDVITRGLDEEELGSWWDLANLIAAFYHELDVFVHIPQKGSTDSLALATDRLKEFLRNGDAANPGGVSVVVIASAATEAATNATRQLSGEGSNIRVEVVEPGTPHEVAKTVVELAIAERSAT
jgi:NAD(P)-dependent dehydrogenase (short-subunit alcohol dehydrogenase family)